MPGCIEPVLDLLGYPAGSVARLGNGALKVRFCNTPFAARLPSWVLGSDVDAHQVMTSRLKILDFPHFLFLPLVLILVALFIQCRMWGQGIFLSLVGWKMHLGSFAGV